MLTERCLFLSCSSAEGPFDVGANSCVLLLYLAWRVSHFYGSAPSLKGSISGSDLARMREMPLSNEGV